MLNDRRTASALLRVSMVALLIVVAAGTLDAKSYTAERFDSAIRVLPGGDIEVDETLVLRFVDGTFTEVFRELPTRHTDGIEVISARMDERDLPFGNGVNQLEVRNRSQVRAIWRFAPTSGSTHTFTLRTLYAASSSNWTGATCWRGGRSPGSMPTPSDRQRSKSPRQLRYCNGPMSHSVASMTSPSTRRTGSSGSMRKTSDAMDGSSCGPAILPVQSSRDRLDGSNDRSGLANSRRAGSWVRSPSGSPVCSC